MAINTNAAPRPDIMLTIAEQWPDLAASFIAHQVLPVFRSAVSTAPIPKFLARQQVERLVKPKYGEFPRGQLRVESAGTFDCKEEGFEEPVDEKDIEIAGGEAQAEQIYLRNALQMAMLAHEAGVAATLMTTATFGSGLNTAAAANWDNASGKPIDDVGAAADKIESRIGLAPNTLVMGAGAYLKLKKNAQIQANVRAIAGHTNMDEGLRFNVGLSTLASVFGVEKVIIGRASKNSANEGQAESLARVWSDSHALLCYTSADDGITPGLGRTFVWDRNPVDDIGDAQRREQVGDLFIGERYDETRTNTMIMRARRYADTLLLNKRAGHLITGI